MHELEHDHAGQEAGSRAEQNAHDPREAVFPTHVPEGNAAAGDDCGGDGDGDDHDLVETVAEADGCHGAEFHEDPSHDAADGRSREGLEGHDQLPPAKGKGFGLGLEPGDGETVEGHASTCFRVVVRGQTDRSTFVMSPATAMRAPLTAPRKVIRVQSLRVLTAARHM